LKQADHTQGVEAYTGRFVDSRSGLAADPASYLWTWHDTLFLILIGAHFSAFAAAAIMLAGFLAAGLIAASCFTVVFSAAGFSASRLLTARQVNQFGPNLGGKSLQLGFPYPAAVDMQVDALYGNDRKSGATCPSANMTTAADENFWHAWAPFGVCKLC
jgi:hypothetical protein